MQLLGTLHEADWMAPTVCGEWRVRDIVAHMLDTQLRLLSMGRDRYQPPAAPQPIMGYRDLVAYLDGLNAEWVAVMRRLSTKVLVEMLRESGPRLSEYVTSLDPHAKALWPVAWAGETESQQWFDIGRSYTEYWHHQQQIRDAVGAPGLMARRWLHPVLALFVRAVPRAYLGASGGTLVVEITGEAGGEWSFVVGDGGTAEGRVVLDQDTAWRLFTKGLSREEARRRVAMEGDVGLCEPFLGVLAVMA